MPSVLWEHSLQAFIGYIIPDDHLRIWMSPAACWYTWNSFPIGLEIPTSRYFELLSSMAVDLGFHKMGPIRQSSSFLFRVMEGFEPNIIK